MAGRYDGMLIWINDVAREPGFDAALRAYRSGALPGTRCRAEPPARRQGDGSHHGLQ
ncbi:hypothetical protein BRAS3843_1200008 [Bradyrhizobium sp. STM 3843]|nr:hypothetical protein BRAS3843_1200008 [Bradyrhizobium sp. STM 3843]